MRVIDVSAGLIFRDGTLLITQRHANDHLGGLWEFPGGKREPGESFEQCLVRELEEELGIRVEVGAELEDLTHAYPEKRVRLKFFKCRLLSGEPRPLGCSQLRWVAPAELERFDFPEADARLLLRLASDAGLWQ